MMTNANLNKQVELIKSLQLQQDEIQIKIDEAKQVLKDELDKRNVDYIDTAEHRIFYSCDNLLIHKRR